MGLPLPSFLSGHHNALWFGLVQLVLTLAIAVLQYVSDESINQPICSIAGTPVSLAASSCYHVT